MISNAEQLKPIVDACRWPPNGSRGVGFSRANLFGKNFKSYFEEAKAPLLIVQIENIDLVNNLEEILQVSGIDAIIIGPYDLTASMGITGDFHNDKFIAIIKNIADLANRYGVPFGDHIVQPDLELLRQRIESGNTFIAYLTDAIFLHANCKNPRLHN